jgi:hypothetical protein
MSKYVVHFTKEMDGKSAYEAALSILHARRIEARNAFGAGRTLPAARKSVCFSEIPLHQLKRLADVRGPYGIGFRKELLVARGGGPILYAYKDTDHAKAVNSMVAAAANQPGHPIWSIAPFIDLPGVYGHTEYLFEWEREWRAVGDFSFTPEDAAFLIIPENLHEAARAFFDDAEQANIGPNYKCKFIDPYWNDETVSSVMPS